LPGEGLLGDLTVNVIELGRLTLTLLHVKVFVCEGSVDTQPLRGRLGRAELIANPSLLDIRVSSEPFEQSGRKR
jgi:hypothetical protein